MRLNEAPIEHKYIITSIHGNMKMRWRLHELNLFESCEIYKHLNVKNGCKITCRGMDFGIGEYFACNIEVKPALPYWSERLEQYNW